MFDEMTEMSQDLGDVSECDEDEREVVEIPVEGSSQCRCEGRMKLCIIGNEVS